jgi:cytochrome P450
MTGSTETSSVKPKDPAEIRLPFPPELVERGKCPFDPPPGLGRLSEKGRVQQVELLTGEIAWMVTGHDEGRAVLADPRLSADRFRNPERLKKMSEAMRKRLTDKKARAGSFITMDAPEHTRYRKLLTGQFTVRRMRQLGPRILEIVTDRLDAMIAEGPTADLVRDFALPVPSLVICELLGVQYDDRAEFQERTSKLLSLDVPIEEVLKALDDLREFMRGLVQEKRRKPTDDLLSGLVHADTDTPLDDDELVGIANLLLVAGHETTANMLALGTFALLEHPDQFTALRDDPTLIDGAVEELLRYLSIVHLGVARITLEEIEVGGQVIPEGAMVMVSVPEANRDERYYEDPADLDVTRHRPSHLAFGHGIHQCLGQQLARVEMTVGFTELLRRLPTLRLAVPADEVPLRSDMAIYGVHKLPVTWDVE